MVKLNGWHRIFVVISAVLIVACGVRSGMKYRTRDTAQAVLRDLCIAKNDNFLRGEIEKQRSVLANAAAQAAADAADVSVGKFASDSSEALSATFSSMEAKIQEIKLLEIQSFYKEKKWQNNCVPDESRVTGLHQSWFEIWKEGTTILFGQLVAALVAVYVSGWSLAWIRRGFGDR